MAAEKLPSTRQLADLLGISRNVVLEAYDQLLAEGFLVSKRGAGTFVAEGAYLPSGKSIAFQKVTNKEEVMSEPSIIQFRSGIPALDLFPRRIWGKLTQSICYEVEASAFNYDVPQGRPELREALSKYVKNARGIECHPEQIVITTGATQAFTLASKLLVSPGDELVIEDPITSDIQVIFTNHGAKLIPVPVDDSGIQTCLLPQDTKPAFVFVAPSHQFPLGGVLSIQRRVELIQYARKTNSYIVEDDYDSEFRYEGAPIPSLQGLAPDRVLYVGSFSKLLSPSLRLGYLILPPEFIDRGRKEKWFLDLHTPSLNQLVLARFIQEGHLERHLMKMRKSYKKKRDRLIDCLHDAFTGEMKVLGASTGLHLIVEFRGRTFTERTMERMRTCGVFVDSVESHAIKKGSHLERIILGYGHLSMEQIEEGVRRLQQALTFD